MGILPFVFSKNVKVTYFFDLYLITGKQFKVTYFFMKGNHKYELKWADADEAKIAETMGVLIFKISSNMIDVVKNGFTLYEAFYKGDVKHFLFLFPIPLLFLILTKIMNRLNILDKFLKKDWKENSMIEPNHTLN